MEDIAGWVALVATCTAALMTASNLGARVTGWGFVVFSIGAVAWIVMATVTDQSQLLWSNIFLLIVNVFGVWRWLGRRARFSDASEAEETRSEASDSEDLFSIAGLDGMPVKGADGTVIAHAVDALAACHGGRIDYLIVREGGLGGIGETLRRLPWSKARVRAQALETDFRAGDLAKLPIADVA